jgi:O-antigen/teichoic acid export membrane protein
MKDNKVVSNVIWRLFERCGAQVITFIVTTILARILTPDDYGTLTLVLVFITILQVFVDSGMGSALIQKKNADQLDFSTVFYFNFLMSVGLYLLMVGAAPLISAFYGKPELTPIIRVLSLILIASGVRNVQQAYVARHMQFKRFFYATIIGTIVSGALGIWMAYCGFGIWAMVARQLSSVVIDTVVLWIVVEWKPKWEFSFGRLKHLLSFGWKILVTGLLDVAYSNVRQLVIGKMYTAEELAYNSKGKQIPELVGVNVNAAVDGVLLPAMSAVQDQLEQVKKIMHKATQINSYIMTPLLIGLACVAKPVIHLLLTDKWLDAVSYMQLFCVFYLFYSHQLTNRNALKSIGRSDMVLKLEIANKIIGFG